MWSVKGGYYKKCVDTHGMSRGVLRSMWTHAECQGRIPRSMWTHAEWQWRILRSVWIHTDCQGRIGGGVWTHAERQRRILRNVWTHAKCHGGYELGRKENVGDTGMPPDADNVGFNK
jgi:hypothetical protein